VSRKHSQRLVAGWRDTAGIANNCSLGGKVTCVNESDGVGVLIQRLDPGLPLPRRAHPGDAGADLCAAADVELAPGQRAVVPTGIAIALPDGYAAFVHPRSGLAARHGITIVNAPGTVDAGYRGEIRVTLLNTDADRPVRFQRGDRIAQLVIQRVERPVFVEVETLPGSARGDGGFGSTGGHAAAGQTAGWAEIP
jgi:dUTP pyrophosphatase